MFFLISKQNNELLMRNPQFHLIRSEPFPKANTISTQTHGQRQGCGHGHGHVCMLQL